MFSVLRLLLAISFPSRNPKKKKFAKKARERAKKLSFLLFRGLLALKSQKTRIFLCF
jgi:hypothetical protein